MSKILIVAPHVDDELWSVGLVKAKYPESEVIVCYGCTTRNMFTGTFDATDEIIKSAKMLGYSEDYLSLGLVDGQFDMYSTEKLSNDLLSIFKQVKPDVVLSPYIYDLNQDHTVLTNALRITLRSYRVGTLEWIMYETPSTTDQALIPFNPNLFVEVSEETFKLKMDVYDTYVTGMPTTGPLSKDGVATLMKMRGHMISKSYAEAFQIMRSTFHVTE